MSSSTPGTSAEPATAAAAPPPAAPTKVVIVFQAAGGAPLLKADRVKISADSRFSKVVAHLKRQLGSDSLFVYLRNAFCPALDEELGVLAAAYGSEGRLHVSYALTPAWG
jgi:ubiquitin-like protein ATG12